MNHERIYTVVAVLTIALTTSAVMAVPTIDGVVDGAGALDGYSVHAILEASGEQGVSEADVFLHQAPNSQFLYMAFVLPLDFVDNTYGDQVHSSWGKAHRFKDLLCSDEFKIEAIGASGEKKVTIDYLNAVKEDHVYVPPFYAYAKKDDIDLVAEVASSLEYNLITNTSGTWTTNSPELGPGGEYPANWTSEVIYEVKIDLAQLYAPDAGGDYPNVLKSDGTGLDSGFSLTLTDLHASPNKGGDNTFGPNVPTDYCLQPPVNPIPVPGALVMGAIGLGMVGWTRKRFLGDDK